jgi:hypothetical protein
LPISAIQQGPFFVCDWNMPMKWFRFWNDTINDVKILQLSDYEYRIWTYLLSYASASDSTSGQLQITFKLLSLHFHQRFNLFSRAIETFRRVGLITITEDGYITITNWNKRQFKSDDVTDRVRKHREVTTKRNVSVTVPDTDTDTDTDKDKYITKPIADKITKKRSNGFHPPTIEEVVAYCSDRNSCINPEQFFNHYESIGWMRGKNKMKDWKATIRTWEGNEYNKPNKPKHDIWDTIK